MLAVIQCEADLRLSRCTTLISALRSSEAVEPGLVIDSGGGGHGKTENR